jgi:trehalose/maltose transport system substrate-binding protein
MEWFVSSGGGNVIDNGKVTVDNQHNVDILNLAKSWVGKISPSGVTAFIEEDSRNAFTTGAAAFLRNWPYVYALAGDPKNSKIVGNFDVAPLPHGANGDSAGTVGGWQYGINGNSALKEAAAAWITYRAGPDFQKYQAINTTTPPTEDEVSKDADVLKANPWLSVQTNRVVRPSKLGTKYNQGSTFIFQAVNGVLRGGDAAAALKQLKVSLEGLLT